MARLTPQEEDDILGPVADSLACDHYSPGRAYLDLRAALRLDDPILEHVIRTAVGAGEPLSWRSEVPV